MQDFCIARTRAVLVFVEDLIEIQDVALLNESEEWTDDVYSLSAGVMDGVSIS